MSNKPNEIANTEDFEFEALSQAVNYRAAIMHEFSPYLKGRVLEVGAGIGQISQSILEQENVDELVAVEPEEKFHDRFIASLPKTRLVKGTTNDLGSDESFDAAIMVNVLEHIDDDEDELSRLQSILKNRSGALCILVPARQEIYSKLDHHFGHFRRYHRRDLREKLERAGFTVSGLFYYNFVGYFAWGIRYKLLQGMSFDPAQVRLFDRKIFPIFNKLERSVIRPPFGQSLVAIARA